MKLTRAATKEQYRQIEALYMRAFPKEERKPFSRMVKKQAEGSMELLCIEDDAGLFLGLAIYVLDGDLALLDYLAIMEEYRNQGIGSKILSRLQTYYPGKRFLLEIEDAAAESEDQSMRIRRKAFYLRNGMKVMPFLVNLFTVEMEVLTFETEVGYEEYFDIYNHVFGPEISKHVMLVRYYEDTDDNKKQI